MKQKNSISKLIGFIIFLLVSPANFIVLFILRFKKGGIKAIGPLIAIATAVLMVYLFILSPTTVDGKGMAPTLANGDAVIINKMQYDFSKPQRGEIVVYKDPRNQDIDRIGRIIAIGNDMVQIKEGIIMLNGVVLQEQYAVGITISLETPKEGETVKVPEGSAYILMDNRLITYDSRSHGIVPYDDLIGMPIFRHWPPERLGLVKNGVASESDLTSEDLYKCGVYFMSLKNMIKAEEYFLKAITVSRYAPAYVDLGYIYFEKNDYVKAAPYFQNALEIEPENPAALYNLGSINLNQGNSKVALEYYQKALTGYVKLNTPEVKEIVDKLKSFLFENGIK